MTRMVPAACRWLIPVMLIPALAAAVLASPPIGQSRAEPAAAGRAGQATHARQMLERAYQMSRAAQTPEQIDRSLKFCQQLERVPLTEPQRKYVERLIAWLYNHRGELYTQQAAGAQQEGNGPEAEQFERRAIRDFDASIDLTPSWRALHNRGVSHSMLGKYDQAIADFDAALEKKPDATNTRYNRAEILFQVGRYQEAESGFDSVLQKEPADLDALVGRAHARYELGRVEEALDDFHTVVQRAPDRAEAYADRADALAALGRWEQAARDYRMAIRLDNQLGRAYESVAWLMATCPDPRFQNAQLALKAAQRAIELDGSDDYRYLDTLAAAMASAQQYQKAASTVRRAIQVAPHHAVPELEQHLALYQSEKPYRQRH